MLKPHKIYTPLNKGKELLSEKSKKQNDSGRIMKRFSPES